MFSSPMNTRRTPACGRLLDEVRDLVAERVDLDGEADVRMPSLRSCDQAVEQRSPSRWLRAKLSSVMKKRLMPCASLSRMIFSRSSGDAEAALAALHVDDGAERALVGAAAAEIDARQRCRRCARHACAAGTAAARRQRRQVVHEVVERLERAVPGVAQHLVEPALLGLAGEERDAHAPARRGYPPAIPAAWRCSRRHGSRRCRPAGRRQETAAPDRPRAETGWIARRPGRSAPGRPARRISG